MSDLFPDVASDMTDTDERYTTRETLAWAKRVAGITAFDLDVAACDEAHCAPRWYDKRADGLSQPWFPKGIRFVWCNNPWSDVTPWIVRAWAELRGAPRDAVLCALEPTNTEQGWWQRHVEPFRDPPGRWEPNTELLPPGQRADAVNVVGVTTRDLIVGDPAAWRLTTHFLPGRTKYGHPGNVEAKGKGSPPFKSVLLVWRAAS